MPGEEVVAGVLALPVLVLLEIVVNLARGGSPVGEIGRAHDAIFPVDELADLVARHAHQIEEDI